ncbi:hypothetical protein [Sphingomonas sp. PR090111-T3T-6A]|uniref:hypothetical protein n=1 Tax=Sphingomonas sp. PR090111-T3T-6A TaxID=685778 RepID=UPI00036ECD04|nr:hypothetical protein [Sphingomonas sp. PR090111-T3T-6A]
MSSTPDQLPSEIDFQADDDASPERMNRAMTYLMGQVRTVLALKPDYQAAIDQLMSLGLDRLNQILSPLLLQGQADAAALAQLLKQWEDSNALEDLKEAVEDELLPKIQALTDTLVASVPETDTAGLMLTSSGDPEQPNVWANPYTRQQAEADRWFFG